MKPHESEFELKIAETGGDEEETLIKKT